MVTVNKNYLNNSIAISNKTDFDNRLSEKSEKIKKIIIETLSSSTAHGIPNILKSNNLFLIIFWSIVCGISLCVGSYFVIDNVLDYLEYHTVTTISVINEKQTQFPTISICSHPSINKTLNETFLRVRFDRVFEANVGKYFEQFEDPVFGKCFRFNSGRNVYAEKLDILNSTTNGRPNGLRIEVFVDMPKEYDFVELIINIHNHSTPPYNIDYGGYWITPGSWNYFEIERVFDQRLGEPYNECLKDVSKFTKNKTIINHILETGRHYSQNDCFYMCSNLCALEESKCGCNSTLINFEKNCLRQFYEEDKNVTKKCIAKYLKEFRKAKIKSKFDKCTIYCPSECDSMTYRITPSFEAYPAFGKISQKSKIENGLKKFKTYEEVRKHFSSVLVYYKDLKYTLIAQEPRTQLFNVISNIGGILGLFLGISFLSFMELIEILFQIIYIKYFEPNVLTTNKEWTF